MSKVYREVNKKQLFHKFFLKIKSQLKLTDEMEGVLWKHLVAIKHDTEEKFKEGIRHFGYKVE